MVPSISSKSWPLMAKTNIATSYKFGLNCLAVIINYSNANSELSSLEGKLKQLDAMENTSVAKAFAQ